MTVFSELVNMLEAFSLLKVENRDSEQWFFSVKTDNYDPQLKARLDNFHLLFTPKLDLDLGKTNGTGKNVLHLQNFGLRGDLAQKTALVYHMTLFSSRL